MTNKHIHTKRIWRFASMPFLCSGWKYGCYSNPCEERKAVKHF